MSWLTLFNMQFVARLTAGIIQTYQQCDPKFKYTDDHNPKRYLTSPSVPAHNDGLDNANWDLILYVNLELVNKMSNRRLLSLLQLGIQCAIFASFIVLKCALLFWHSGSSSRKCLAREHLDKLSNAGTQKLMTMLLSR